MLDLGVIAGNDDSDEACLSICQWAGWNFSHADC